MTDRLLSKSQKVLLQLLHTYGCLREEQAETMLAAALGTNKKLPMEVILRQLVYLGLLRREGPFLWPEDGKLDAEITRVVDVMLELMPVEALYGIRREPPQLLTFFKYREEKLIQYDIYLVKETMEPVVSAMLEQAKPDRVNILLLEDLRQQELIPPDCNRVFAVSDNGKCRFYK